MDSPKWCNLCKRNVVALKNFNWLVFIFLLGIFYLPYHIFFAHAKCPICQGENFSVPKASALEESA